MNAIGGKAQSLIRLRDEFGLPVPEFVVVPFEELIASFSVVTAKLNDITNEYFHSGNERKLLKQVDKLITNVELNSSAIEYWHGEISKRGWSKVSFRTSALIEDGPETSFAGQYETFLDIEYSKSAFELNARKCFESMLSLRVLSYARSRGLVEFPVAGSLIVQEMFYGTSSGVLFTENGSGYIAIEVSSSWRNLVVEGEDSVELIVARADIASSTISKEMQELCRLALGIESLVGRPLDLEWSARKGEVKFLQMRPITVPRLDYALEWDSTNISENYPGVTLPLTYSVIRELYSGVYMAFLRLLGTKEELLVKDQAQFRNMLGYLNGHVYYRITNWYELLKFLPGRANQQFFESMLNPVTTRGEKSKTGRKLDLKSLFAILRFLFLISRSEAKSRKFRRSFAKKLAFFRSYQVDYINAAELLSASAKVRAELLADWATPILNDVKLMVFHGVLKKYFFQSEDQTEYLNFLQGLADKASIKPLEHLATVGKIVASALETESVNSIAKLRSTPSWSLVLSTANEYVSAFGSRTPGELKLESIRLTDDLNDVLELALKAHNSTFSAGRQDAETNHATVKRLNWPKGVPFYQRPMLRWVANNTKRAIDWRERFRFNRAQTFDLSRNLYDAVGKILANEGLLAKARDVYWLTEQEIDELVNAHGWSLDARSTVTQRKKLLPKYLANSMPLAARGAGQIAANSLTEVLPKGDFSGLSGKGVAPGTLKAEVLVCREFDVNIDVRGKILVVHHIDPGWTLLFTQAAGIIAERGNALSHAAIIAREIGIPAIVAVPRATTDLVSGEIISMNGVLGTITREEN